MHALVFDRYGAADVLHWTETEKPVAEKEQVLVKVAATSINDFDWSMVRGKPGLYRLMFGLFKPKSRIPGMEVAGTVEACGPEVTRFQVGDAVYGDTSDYNFGTWAEYVAVDERALLSKPVEISFVEAAALPHAALLAWQALENRVQPGQRLLINGAGGGVGSFGLQLGRLHGAAETTGVDTGEKLKKMEELGFDRVIDYRQTDFTKTGERYDLILDAKTNRPPRAYLRALKPGGTYITVGGQLQRLVQLLLWKTTTGRFRREALEILALKPNQGLEEVGSLYASGTLKCPIDGPYPLEEGRQALVRFGDAKHAGKVILVPTTN